MSLITPDNRTEHLMNHSLPYIQGWIDCELGDRPTINKTRSEDYRREYEAGYNECYTNACITTTSGDNHENR